MTYEHGKAPADAPVMWVFSDHPHVGWILRPGVPIGHWMARVVCASIKELEWICRAFHLANLAEEAAGYLSKPRHEGESDWLARFDAAKGDA